MNKENVLKLLSEFKQKNSEEYKISELGIFGSVAKEKNNSNSDIDIVVKTMEANLFMFVHIKEELEDLLNMDVDIVRYREKMNPYLKKHIDEEAVYVWW